ncbi:4677_t:CDS:2 [Funneliformis geosporum]|uniref:2088_t:CDS:1 n=1 Tax=Funneliformis geosporum TaxID=1117311 RepID=A0A9W4SV17_9GLOM|nr:2088_t:CDS:2 [Funneliformis geosporum]CAI2183237.1 4677_t:CDS:2 [Funneliformis geosporum]
MSYSSKYIPTYKTIFVDSTDDIQLELIYDMGVNKIQHVNLPPLLFVHGSYHAAWCWENFLGWFSGRGFDCFALSLRGHGESTKIASKDSAWSLEQYVEDVSSVVEFLCENGLSKPIIIGHAMGGAICQKYLETSSDKVTSCVLLCSIPPTGLIYSLPNWFTSVSLTMLSALILQNPYFLISTPERARKSYFSSNVPKDLLDEYHSKFESTFNKKVNLQTLTTFIDMKKIMNQKNLMKSMIIIGGERDCIIPINVLDKLGKSYGGIKVDIVRNVAHDVMLEVKWEDVATVILKRIQEKLFEQFANIY